MKEIVQYLARHGYPVVFATVFARQLCLPVPAILFLLAAYMVTTWAQDRKRSKRAVHAPAGDDAVDLELGPIDAGGGVTPP